MPSWAWTIPSATPRRSWSPIRAEGASQAFENFLSFLLLFFFPSFHLFLPAPPGGGFFFGIPEWTFISAVLWDEYGHFPGVSWLGLRAPGLCWDGFFCCAVFTFWHPICIYFSNTGIDLGKDHFLMKSTYCLAVLSPLLLLAAWSFRISLGAICAGQFFRDFVFRQPTSERF